MTGTQHRKAANPLEKKNAMSTPNVSLDNGPSSRHSFGPWERVFATRASSIRRGKPRRYAFSLMEMLVVLSLLGVMLSMAWPSMRRTLGKSQLREAAKQVRTQLATARLAAMESGRPQQFRYQPGTGRFVITPLDSPLEAPFDPDAELATSSSSSLATGLRHSEQAGDDCRRQPVQSLGGGVVFGTADIREAYGIAGNSSTEMTLADTQRPREIEVSRHADWSAPVVFYPNGRSADATVRLYGERDFQVDVNLRGVLGTVEVAAPVRVPESFRR
jgi:prepilin-type N-terminal cleavage/methylation domain-containing protein